MYLNTVICGLLKKKWNNNISQLVEQKKISNHRTTFNLYMSLLWVLCSFKNFISHCTLSTLQHIPAVEESVEICVTLILFFFFPLLLLHSTSWFQLSTNICFVVQAVIHHKTLWTKKWAAFRCWIGADRRKHPTQEVTQGAVLWGGVRVCACVCVAVVKKVLRFCRSVVLLK